MVSAGNWACAGVVKRRANERMTAATIMKVGKGCNRAQRRLGTRRSECPELRRSSVCAAEDGGLADCVRDRRTYRVRRRARPAVAGNAQGILTPAGCCRARGVESRCRLFLIFPLLPLKVQIKRNTRSGEQEAEDRFDDGALTAVIAADIVVNGCDEIEGREGDEDRREDGVAFYAERPGVVRHSFAQDEETDRGEAIEDPGEEDEHIGKDVEAAAVYEADADHAHEDGGVAGGAIAGMDSPTPGEEVAPLPHREEDADVGEEIGIRGAKGGDDDQHRDEPGRSHPEDLFHRVGGNEGGVGHLPNGNDIDVREGHQGVDTDTGPKPDEEAAADVSARVLDLARDHIQIIPPVIRGEGPGGGGHEGGQEEEDVLRMKVRAVGDEVGRVTLAGEEESSDEQDKCQGLEGRSEKLNDIALLRAAIVEYGEAEEDGGGGGFYAEILQGIDIGDEGKMELYRGFDGGVEARQVDEETNILSGDEGHGGKRGGVDDDGGGPAIDEGGEVAVGLLQVDIGAAGVGEHRPQFGIDHGAEQGDRAGDDPDEEEHVRRTQPLGHGGG